MGGAAGDLGRNEYLVCGGGERDLPDRLEARPMFSKIVSDLLAILKGKELSESWRERNIAPEIEFCLTSP